MEHPCSELLDGAAKAACHNIHTFNGQDLAITVNAFAKLDHRSPELFDRVANAATRIIDEFNSHNKARGG